MGAQILVMQRCAILSYILLSNTMVIPQDKLNVEVVESRRWASENLHMLDGHYLARALSR